LRRTPLAELEANFELQIKLVLVQSDSGLVQHVFLPVVAVKHVRF
jgi:hypothetical protein